MTSLHPLIATILDNTLRIPLATTRRWEAIRLCPSCRMVSDEHTQAGDLCAPCTLEQQLAIIGEREDD